jgi:peptidoglycan-associated lipoprotein
MSLRYLTTIALVTVVAAGCSPRQQPAPPAPDPVAVERSAADRAAADRAAAERAAADRAAAERAAAERATAERMARAREVLTERVHFEFDSDRITSDAQERLRTKAAILRANPGLAIRIEGHADERGTTEYNLALGQRRAEAVRAFLAGFDIAHDRMSTVSYGKERPLTEGSSESAWAMNRRAEFTATRGEISTVPAEVR